MQSRTCFDFACNLIRLPYEFVYGGAVGTCGFFTANFSQYLFLKEDPASIQEKMRSGEALNGVGIFGRFGTAPHRTNPIERNASIALYAQGLFNARRYDSFGVGFYYNQFSRDLKNDITLLTAGTDKLSNERGVEVFYDLATPAVRSIPSYQHILRPARGSHCHRPRSRRHLPHPCYGGVVRLQAEPVNFGINDEARE